MRVLLYRTRGKYINFGDRRAKKVTESASVLLVVGIDKHPIRKNPTPQCLECNNTQRNAVSPLPIYASKRSVPQIVTMIEKDIRPVKGWGHVLMYRSLSSNFTL